MRELCASVFSLRPGVGSERHISRIRRQVSFPGGLVRLLAVGAAVGLALPAAAAAAATQVSSDPFTNTTSFHATEVEPDTFASGSGTMVSAFQQGRFSDGGASDVGWATTTNGGTSYSSGSLPGITGYTSVTGPFARDTDPSVAFDAKHGLWLIATLALSSNTRGRAVLVSSSADGVTWGNPTSVAIASGGQDFDKNWIVCDDTSTSPHYGNCYVEWDDFGHSNQLHMALSGDGGTTWAGSSVPRHAAVIGGQPVVQPNGTVVMPIDNASETAIESFVSTNGGASYKGPYSISTIASHAEAGNLRSGPLPSAEVDGAGRVYVAWSDCRFITGCTANDIVYSSSANGTSWSAVARIPLDLTTSGVDHFLPGLGVDPSTSGSTAKLGLTYYYYPSTGCATSTCQLDVGFASSSDGGSMWTAPTQLAGPSSLDELPLTNQGYMVGDYLSSSFVSPGSAVSVFAVGLPVSNKTCTLGDVTSCHESMEAPSPFAVSRATTRHATTGPVKSTSSSRPVPTGPLKLR
jgi:hypothetical protein